jgi:alanyl-tRNA synthetase
LRRIEAVTGSHSVAYIQRTDDILNQVATAVGTRPEDALAGVLRRLDDLKSAQDELKVLRSKMAAGRASELAGDAVNGLVVARIDGMSASDIRDLAIAIRQNAGVQVVVLGGVTDSGGVSLVCATTPTISCAASDLLKDAARAVGGGGGGKGDIATAGGKNVEALDLALSLAREAAEAVMGSVQ